MRADLLLFTKGFAKSRENAKKLIKDGVVSINGRTVAKPSEDYDETVTVDISQNDINKYVSRGGLKLEYALEEFNIDVTGAVAIDIGASTGGFTDCLLQHGARLVYAVDVGIGQLDSKLSSDARVVSIEKCNAREPVSAIEEKCDIAVMDVSFISQTLLFKTVNSHLKENGIFISLIKPQFEAGKAHLTSGGIVKSEKVRMEVIEKVKQAAYLEGFQLVSYVTSPIKGGDGNTEYLAYFLKRVI